MLVSRRARSFSICLLFFLLLASGISPVLGAEEIKSVGAEGVAAILQGNLAVARDAAIEDALRKAVEQAVGIFLDSETLVENFQLVNDRILTQSRGYIRGYRILQESRDENTLRVMVEASVAAGRLQDDLAALRALMVRKHRPRVMVLIDEVSLGEYGQIGPWSDLSQVEAILTQKMREKGFHFVDQAAVRRNISRDRALLLIEGNMEGARAIASEHRAELLILGKATARPTPVKDLRPLDRSGMRSCQAQLSARAFRPDTGETLASVAESAAAVHIDEMVAASEALRKAAEKVAAALIEQITEKWGQETKGTAVIELVISGLAFRDLSLLKEVLGREVKGVKGVHQRSYQSQVARIDVDYAGDPQILAEELALRDFRGVRLEVVGFSAHRIDLRVAP